MHMKIIKLCTLDRTSDQVYGGMYDLAEKVHVFSQFDQIDTIIDRANNKNYSIKFFTLMLVIS